MKKRNDSCKKCPSYNNAYAARYMRDNFLFDFAFFGPSRTPVPTILGVKMPAPLAFARRSAYFQ